MPSKRDQKCGTCPTLIARENRTGLCDPCYRAQKAQKAAAPTAPAAEPTLAHDRKLAKVEAERNALQRKYQEAIALVEQREHDMGVFDALQQPREPLVIEPKHGKNTGEGTVVVALSDWHSEELVGAEVGGLNVFNPEIAEDRVKRCFRAILRLTNLLKQDLRINDLVLALLGDFITGQIHGAENAEKNAMPPMEAIVQAQRYVIAGIDFLLTHSDLSLVVPCHSGNHARTTQTTRFASENGHSLEYLMYRHLEAYYRHEPRVRIEVAAGMHSYVQVYDQTLRFHHGHAVKYGGGVGGIYIPVNKSIAQWNKARHADLDVFGHFHQLRDGGNFLCNGSLIGYNSFALSIKADYEEPKQAMFLIDKKRGRTCTWPILVAAERQLHKGGQRCNR